MKFKLETWLKDTGRRCTKNGRGGKPIIKCKKFTSDELYSLINANPGLSSNQLADLMQCHYSTVDRMMITMRNGSKVTWSYNDFGGRVYYAAVEAVN